MSQYDTWSTAQLKAAVEAIPADLSGHLGKALRFAATSYTRAAEQLEAAWARSDAGWRGIAAENARDRAQNSVQWARDMAQVSGEAATTAERIQTAVTAVKAAMPAQLIGSGVRAGQAGPVDPALAAQQRMQTAAAVNAFAQVSSIEHGWTPRVSTWPVNPRGDHSRIEPPAGAFPGGTMRPALGQSPGDDSTVSAPGRGGSGVSSDPGSGTRSVREVDGPDDSGAGRQPIGSRGRAGDPAGPNPPTIAQSAPFDARNPPPDNGTFGAPFNPGPGNGQGFGPHGLPLPNGAPDGSYGTRRGYADEGFGTGGREADPRLSTGIGRHAGAEQEFATGGRRGLAPPRAGSAEQERLAQAPGAAADEGLFGSHAAGGERIPFVPGMSGRRWDQDEQAKARPKWLVEVEDPFGGPSEFLPPAVLGEWDDDTEEDAR